MAAGKLIWDLNLENVMNFVLKLLSFPLGMYVNQVMFFVAALYHITCWWLYWVMVTLHLVEFLEPTVCHFLIR